MGLDDPQKDHPQTITVRDKRTRNWFWVENILVDRDDLDIYEKLTYIVLCRFADEGSQSCFPSYDTISQKVGCSKRKVIDVLKSLREKSLIEIHARYSVEGGQTSNLYYLPPIGGDEPHAPPPVNDMHPPVEPHAPGGVNDVHQGSAPRAPGVVHGVHPNNTYINNTHLTILSLSVLSPSEREKLFRMAENACQGKKLPRNLPIEKVDYFCQLVGERKVDLSRINSPAAFIKSLIVGEDYIPFAERTRRRVVQQKTESERRGR